VTSLQGRLKKLESLLTDPSGLVPHSEKWRNTGSAGLIVGQMIRVSGLGSGCRSKPPVRSSHAHPTMTHFERRLKKLEALLTDSSALVPYSPRWFEYWDEQMYFILTGREVKPGQLPPDGLVAVLRYAVQSPASLVSTIPASDD
jgi:hypothetical protein